MSLLLYLAHVMFLLSLGAQADAESAIDLINFAYFKKVSVTV